MLLLPLTPPLIYLKLKKNKGPKTHSLLFNKLFYKGIPLGKVTDSTLYIHKHGGRRSIAGIKESWPLGGTTFQFISKQPSTQNKKHNHPQNNHPGGPGRGGQPRGLFFMGVILLYFHGWKLFFTGVIFTSFLTSGN